MHGELKYLVDFGNNIRNVVSASVAECIYPKLVAGFLEANLDRESQSFKTKFLLTRSKASWATRYHVTFVPKVKLIRDIGLEKFVLKEPSAQPINQRRVTLGAPNQYQPKKIVQRRATNVQLKSVKSVPFGARGRKRRTVNVLYIGIAPNPDGRPVAAQSTAENVAHSSGATNGEASTSKPPNLTMSDDSFNTIDEESIDKSTMGRLNYSSSE